MAKYPRIRFPIYYAANKQKNTKKKPLTGPRLVFRMDCNKKPLADDQLCLGMHEYLADAFKVAEEKRPDWEFAICPCCQEYEDGRVAG